MRFFSKVWSSAKKLVKKVKDTVIDVVKNPNKVWNGLTGRTTFEEAEILLREIEDKYDKAINRYKERITFLSRKIEEKVLKINYHKTDIYEIHFRRFINLGNRLHNISIKGKNFLEYFDDSITKVKTLDGIRSKDEIYAIDFNNLKFTEIALGILTLGFFTRKKAKQTLLKVQEEEIRVNEEIQKIESQIFKAEVILASIDNVNEYFTVLIKNYIKLLDRFEYGIKSQIQKNILKRNFLKDGKIDFKMMPIIHIEEFHSLFNLSIVLKQMSSMGYLSDNGEIKDEDIESLENVKVILNNSNLLVS